MIDLFKTQSRDFFGINDIRLGKLPNATFVTKTLLETDKIG